MTIVFGALGVVIETLPQFYGDKHHFWFIFESVLIGLFTLEFGLRCVANSETAGQMWAFLGSFFTLVDLASIIPFYLELIIQGSSIGEFQKFTILRLFRLVRLLRTFQSSMLLKMSVEAMIIAVNRSFETLLAIIIFLCLVVIVSSTMIYYVERGEYDPVRKAFIDIDGLPSQFDSIPSTFWFVLEIVTTVGLGDVYPKTIPGKVMTFPVMMFGLLVIALPSIVMGRNFADAWTLLRVNRVRSSRRGVPFAFSPTNDASLVEEGLKLHAAPAAVGPQPSVPDRQIEKTAAHDRPAERAAMASEESIQALLSEVRRQSELLERLLGQHDQ